MQSVHSAEETSQTLAAASETETVLNRLLIKNVALYAMSILSVFGVVERIKRSDFGLETPTVAPPCMLF